MNQIKLVQPSEIQGTKLPPMQAAALLMAMNSVLLDAGEVTVSLTYPKQTKGKPRIAGVDYVSLPGVSHDAHIGQLSVHRRVNNRQNRRDGVVDRVFVKVNSFTRGDGVNPTNFTNIRPNDVTAFVVTGFLPNAEAIPAPPPQGA